MAPGRTACCEWTSWPKGSLEQRRDWTRMPRITRKLALGVVRDRQDSGARRDEREHCVFLRCAAAVAFAERVSQQVSVCSNARAVTPTAIRDGQTASQKPLSTASPRRRTRIRSSVAGTRSLHPLGTAVRHIQHGWARAAPRPRTLEGRGGLGWSQRGTVW